MRRKQYNHYGFVQIVPMIVLAVLALTTFVVTGVVEKKQQDIRSNAASIIGQCKKSSTSTCVPMFSVLARQQKHVLMEMLKRSVVHGLVQQLLLQKNL